MSTLPPCSPGRDGAQALRGEGFLGRHCAGGRGADDRAAAAQQLVLPQQYLLPQRPRRGHADGAHERRFGNADAGQLLRRGETVAHLPMADERLGVQVAEEAEAGQDGGEAPRGRFDVQDVDFQQVAGFRSVHVNRAGQRMHKAQVRPQ